MCLAVPPSGEELPSKLHLFDINMFLRLYFDIFIYIYIYIHTCANRRNYAQSLIRGHSLTRRAAGVWFLAQRLIGSA